MSSPCRLEAAVSGGCKGRTSLVMPLSGLSMGIAPSSWQLKNFTWGDEQFIVHIMLINM